MQRQLHKHFEAYQKARRDFVQMVAESAMKSENLPILMELNVLALLRPLLLDIIPTIQQIAALSVSRLALFNEKNAEEIVTSGMLPEVLTGLQSNDSNSRKSACQILKSVAKHSPSLAEGVTNSGCLPMITECLKSNDPSLKEASASALGSIAIHNSTLAQKVVDIGSLPLIVQGINGTDNNQKRVCIQALGNIASHSPSLTQSIIEANSIAPISMLFKVNDSKLKHQCCVTLSQIAKHSVDSAELVVESGAIPQVLVAMNENDNNVRVSAAQLIYEIVHHTQELSSSVLGMGAAASLVKYIKSGSDPIPAVSAVGHIASFSSSFANTLLDQGAHIACLNVFGSSKQDTCKAVSAWALGQIGKHSSETSSSLSSLNALSLLLSGYCEKDASLSLKNNTKEALKLIIQNCEDIESLQPLILRSPEPILRRVLAQVSTLLSKFPKYRVPFVSSGSFRDVQQIKSEPGSKLRSIINAINDSYPDQTVRFYSPEYAKELNKEVEQHKI